jgi:tripartite-type tricarboxylate transporter receptor subunit TctC
MRRSPRQLSAVVVLAALAWHTPAGAQSVADFYRGRTIELVVGYAPGAGFDAFGRLLAGHMGRYIPGQPRLVVKNMPGSANLNATKYLFATAPRDGSVIGIVNPNLFNLAVIEPQTVNVDFNAATWIGNMSSDTKVCFAASSSGVRRLDDLAHKGIHLAGTSKGAGYIYGSILRSLYPANVKIVLGYLSNADIWLAIERGEVDAFCTGWGAIKSRRPEWLADGSISVLLQFAREPDIRLGAVPTVFALDISNDLKKAIAFLTRTDSVTRPVLAPPAVPADRAAALREAFLRTMRDGEFLAAARQANLEIDPADALETAKIVDEITATPPAAIELARRLSE